MSKIMKVCIVLTVVAFLAAPAFAEVQNVKVSGDIKTMGIYRDDFDLKENDNSYDDQAAWYQSIVRVQIDADLTDNVSTCVRILNERDWDVETNATTDMDLDIATITMKELFMAPLTVIIGRQELKYGSGLVVGDPDRNDASTGDSITAVNYSARKAFDAIRAIIDLDNVTIDAFTAKINEGVAATSSVGNDIDLYGVDVSTTIGDIPAAVYVVYANDNQSAAGVNNEEILTVGARGSKAITDALNASLEVAVQIGTYNAIRDQKAWALDAAVDYAMNASMNPIVGASYSFRSGANTSASSTSDQEAWLPLYEDQTQGLIADFLFDGTNYGVNSNCHIINVNATVEPMEDLTASIDYYQYLLDEKLAAGSQTVGRLSTTMKADSDFGSEIDLGLNYAYTEDVAFGLTSAWFNPGAAFDGVNDDQATEVVGSVSVSF
ncbi:MAG: alginate export family protein [Candidatus Omnitrophica bacterium]|nr:alginate export family protein [Candidatus Omnitrophota bacterium]